MRDVVLGSVLDRVDELAEVVRNDAAESERLGRLSPAVMKAFFEAGLFKL